jgi:hypothetical protein
MRKVAVRFAKAAILNLMAVLAVGVAAAQNSPNAAGDERPRARDLGIRIGVYEPGPLDAITDVAGVRVGQVTIIRGENVRTGVTAIFPHAGNMFQEKVAGAVYVFNAFGGGSRHVAYLAPFAVAGIATSIAWLSREALWAGIVATVALLLVCTMRVEPLSYISATDQASERMAQAVKYIHASVPAGGVIVVDYNSSLVMRYYLCSGKGNMIRNFENQMSQFACGKYEMARTRGYEWMFTSENFGPILARMEKQFGWRHGQPIWLVQAAEMRLDAALLGRFGAQTSKEFGQNISVTQLRAP